MTKKFTTRSLLRQWTSNAHQSIALEERYILSFGLVTIGRRVWPETCKNRFGVARAISRQFRHFQPFTAERVTGSTRTQKTFDRAFKDLSNGIKGYATR